MYCSVVIEERSRFAGGGLTYWSDQPVVPGMLVRVPLRSKHSTGIVLAVQDSRPEHDMDVRSIIEILTQKPLLPAASMSLLRWMCEYSMCTPRQALQVLMPSPPWEKLADGTERIIEVDHTTDERLGQTQRRIIDYLILQGPTEARVLRNAARASEDSLRRLLAKKLIKERCVARSNQSAADNSRTISLPLPHIDDATRTIAESIQKDRRPSLIIDDHDLQERCQLYAWLAATTWNQQASSLVLFPYVSQAASAKELLQDALPEAEIIFVSGEISPVQRRDLMLRHHSAAPLIVVGTRAALMIPVHQLGLVIVDDEHERSWKSEQTPRIHARLAAEVLATCTGSRLILASPTPSLDSYRHTATSPSDKTPRYVLHQRCDTNIKKDTQLIDLRTADFGSIYPMTLPLLDAMHDRLARRESIVLLLNRRGTGSGMLCRECRRLLTSSVGSPLSVMTRRGAPWLMDRMTGEMSPIPATCPQCGSTQLTTIGAGTERVESIIRERFPAANIVRADADTLDHPGIFSSILRSFDEGKIDILLGTQPVLAGLRSPHVTLAAVLVADQGLSIPDFRAGERVFQSVSTVIRSMRGRGTAIIQTFRPDAPEIRHAVRGDTLGYLEEEWGVRTRTGYPPVSQLIDLIVRRDEGRARLLKERAEQIGKTLGIAVSEYHGHDVTRFTWVIRLRGKRVREALNMLPLTGVTIDVDPVA